MGKPSETHISLHSKKFVQELLSSLQHEIRNDVTNMQSNAYFLYRKVSPSEKDAKDYMTKINNKAEKILRQIREMADVYSIQLDSFQLHLDTFNIVSFIAEMKESLSKRYSNHDIIVTLPNYSVVSINGDKNRLEMVLKRLISHTNEYGVEGTTTGIELSIVDNHIEIAIWPYKPGQKEQQRKPLKKPHHSKKFTLLNIELALYEEIMSLHKGTLLFSQTSNGDLSFFLTLPLHSLPS